jgi:hypothetical protein
MPLIIVDQAELGELQLGEAAELDAFCCLRAVETAPIGVILSWQPLVPSRLLFIRPILGHRFGRADRHILSFSVFLLLSQSFISTIGKKANESAQINTCMLVSPATLSFSFLAKAAFLSLIRAQVEIGEGGKASFAVN